MVCDRGQKRCIQTLETGGEEHRSSNYKRQRNGVLEWFLGDKKNPIEVANSNKIYSNGCRPHIEDKNNCTERGKLEEHINKGIYESAPIQERRHERNGYENTLDQYSRLECTESVLKNTRVNQHSLLTANSKTSLEECPSSDAVEVQHQRLSSRCSFSLLNGEVFDPIYLPVQECLPEGDSFSFLPESTFTNSSLETTVSSSRLERSSNKFHTGNNAVLQEDYMSKSVSRELNHPIVSFSTATQERHQRRHRNFSYSNTENPTTTPQASLSCAGIGLTDDCKDGPIIDFSKEEQEELEFQDKYAKILYPCRNREFTEIVGDCQLNMDTIVRCWEEDLDLNGDIYNGCRLNIPYTVPNDNPDATEGKDLLGVNFPDSVKAIELLSQNDIDSISNYELQHNALDYAAKADILYSFFHSRDLIIRKIFDLNLLNITHSLSFSNVYNCLAYDVLLDPWFDTRCLCFICKQGLCCSRLLEKRKRRVPFHRTTNTIINIFMGNTPRMDESLNMETETDQHLLFELLKTRDIDSHLHIYRNIWPCYMSILLKGTKVVKLVQCLKTDENKYIFSENMSENKLTCPVQNKVAFGSCLQQEESEAAERRNPFCFLVVGTQQTVYGIEWSRTCILDKAFETSCAFQSSNRPFSKTLNRLDIDNRKNVLGKDNEFLDVLKFHICLQKSRNKLAEVYINANHTLVNPTISLKEMFCHTKHVIFENEITKELVKGVLAILLKPLLREIVNVTCNENDASIHTEYKYPQPNTLAEYLSNGNQYEYVEMQSRKIEKQMHHQREQDTALTLSYDKPLFQIVTHLLTQKLRFMTCPLECQNPHILNSAYEKKKELQDEFSSKRRQLLKLSRPITTDCIKTVLKIQDNPRQSIDDIMSRSFIDNSVDTLSVRTDKTSIPVSDNDDNISIQLRFTTNDTFVEQGEALLRIPNKVSNPHMVDGVFNLKHKRAIRRRIMQSIKIDENPKKNVENSYDEESKSKNDYIETIRGLTWLPIDSLPIPKVEIIVGRIEFDPLNTIIEQLARDENPGPHITMRYELLRFCTLRNYPKRDKPYLIRISGAGFYYAAEGDELVCYCCGMRKSGWTELDKPMEIHTRLSPRCSFLLRNEDVNVPVRVPEEGRHVTDRFAFLNEQTQARNLNAESTEAISNNSSLERSSSELPIANNETQQEDYMSMSVSQEFSRPIINSSSIISERPQRRPGNFSHSSNNSTPEVNSETQQEDYMSSAGSQEFNRPTVSSSSATPERPQRRHGNFSYSSNSSTAIATTTSQTTSAPTHAAGNRNPQPKHPNYAPRSVRVASFQGWPDDLTQTPEVLADAGFYYAGIADCVRCYFCGLGLRHWSEEDNPWIEHARWSRPCLYVKMIKGEEFINLVHLAVQYTENERSQNEEQQTTATATGETNTEHTGNQIPIDEINRLLLTDAAQSVLDMGYQPDMIKKAIEKVLIRDGRAGVSSTNIMTMIFEIEEEEIEAALTNRVNNIEISSNDNSSSNGNTAAASSTALGNGSASTNTATINNDERQRNTVAARPTATGTETSNNTASAHSITTNSMTGNQQSKTNTNKKDAKTVKKENERMKMQTMCQICKNNSVAIVFLPCGHLVTCETCAPTLRNCPMQNCNTIVKGTVKAFMA